MSGTNVWMVQALFLHFISNGIHLTDQKESTNRLLIGSSKENQRSKTFTLLQLILNRTLTNLKYQILFPDWLKLWSFSRSIFVEVMRFSGTKYISMLKNPGNRPFVNYFLEAVLKEQAFLSGIERLDISNNYVNKETFSLLKECFIRAPRITDLNMSGLCLQDMPYI